MMAHLKGTRMKSSQNLAHENETPNAVALKDIVKRIFAIAELLSKAITEEEQDCSIQESLAAIAQDD